MSNIIFVILQNTSKSNHTHSKMIIKIFPQNLAWPRPSATTDLCDHCLINRVVIDDILNVPVISFSKKRVGRFYSDIEGLL